MRVVAGSEERKDDLSNAGVIMGGVLVDLAQDFIEEVSLLDIQPAEGGDDFAVLFRFERVEDSADIGEDVVIDGWVSSSALGELLEHSHDLSARKLFIVISIIVDQLSHEWHIEIVLVFDLVNWKSIHEPNIETLVSKTDELLDRLYI